MVSTGQTERAMNVGLSSMSRERFGSIALYLRMTCGSSESIPIISSFSLIAFQAVLALLPVSLCSRLKDFLYCQPRQASHQLADLAQEGVSGRSPICRELLARSLSPAFYVRSRLRGGRLLGKRVQAWAGGR